MTVIGICLIENNCNTRYNPMSMCIVSNKSGLQRSWSIASNEWCFSPRRIPWSWIEVPSWNLSPGTETT